MTKIFSRFALTCTIAFALGAATMMTSCKDDVQPAPAITITTQPIAPATLTEGAIPANTKLTVVATATEGAMLTYQWYSNTTVSNAGGATIGGATTASYTLPTDLTEGKYYYYCEVGAEGADSKRTNAVTVTVNAYIAPVISITTQPTAPADLIEGLIPADTKLIVEANVIGGATLSYQWYENTSASNTGGTTISGATAASYILPTALAEGNHYYYCVVSAPDAEDKTSDAVTMTVAASPLNARITWSSGGYALTTDPTNGGLFFKFGGVAGLYSGNGAVQILPVNENTEDEFDTADIAWNPTDATTWTTVPSYVEADYPANVDAAYHTAANVKAGKGDPCRLVGLDLAKIKNTAAASLTAADIDNGLWRLPTNEDNQSFSGLAGLTTTSTHWTTLSEVIGGMFPDQTDGSAATFLPAGAGNRGENNGVVENQGGYGLYWSSIPSNRSSIRGYGLMFNGQYINPLNEEDYTAAFAVRCVRQ